MTNSFHLAWFGEIHLHVSLRRLLAFPVWTDRHLFPHSFTDRPLGCFQPLVEDSCISVKICFPTPTFWVCGWAWLSRMVAGCYSPGAPLGCFPWWLYPVLFSPIMPQGLQFPEGCFVNSPILSLPAHRQKPVSLNFAQARDFLTDQTTLQISSPSYPATHLDQS